MSDGRRGQGGSEFSFQQSLGVLVGAPLAFTRLPELTIDTDHVAADSDGEGGESQRPPQGWHDPGGEFGWRTVWKVPVE